MLGCCTVILSTGDRSEQKNFSAPANSKLTGIENFRFVTYSAFRFTKNSIQDVDVLFPPSNNKEFLCLYAVSRYALRRYVVY